MRMVPALCAAIAICLMPAVAQGETWNVRVRAASGPWSVALNRKLPFGQGNEKPPTIVPLFNALSGTMLKIEAQGVVSYRENGDVFDADGDTRLDVRTKFGGSYSFPSEYIDPSANGRPFAVQLMGAFVNGDGVVVGKPFMIGRKVQKEIPEGAVGVALGVNDVDFADNSGFLNVKLTTVKAKVTVE